MLGNQAINTFFVGATAPGLWGRALETIAHDLGADGATLTNGIAVPSRVSCSTGILPIVEEYFTLAANFDSRGDRVNPTLNQGFMGDFDSYTPEELTRDDF